MGKGADEYQEFAVDESSPLLLRDKEPPAWWSTAMCLGVIVVPICCCCCCLLVLLALVLYFAWPATPTVQYSSTSLKTFTLSPSGVNLVFTIYILIVNPNYFHLVADNSRINVTYHQQPIAYIEQPAAFQVRGYSNATVAFTVEYVTNSLLMTGYMLNDTAQQGYIVLDYTGQLDTRVLGRNLTVPFSGTYKASPTSS